MPEASDRSKEGTLGPRTGGGAARRPAFAPRFTFRLAPGFTLVELLVVVGVIAVLIAMLLPVLSKARGSAHRVACISNLRQITMSFHLYAGDNKQRLPHPASAGQSWESMLRVYLTTREAYRCLSDGGLYDNIRSSYDWRDTPDPLTTAAGKPIVEIKRPETVLAFDALPDWHGKGRINAGLIDGSASTMDYHQCLEDLDKPIVP